MKKKQKRSKRYLWVLTAVTALVVLISWSAQSKPRGIPDELVGVWKSSDPSYADRSFEIGLVSISFGTGEGTVSTGFIRNIDVVLQGDRLLYNVSYDEDGTRHEVSFYYL